MKFHCMNSVCIQDTLSSRAALGLPAAAFRPSASRASVLNHSTLEFRYFSERPPVVDVILNRRIFER